MGKIVVIGAGVVGLTTARLLQERGHSVVIVAKWLPGDMSIEYTSPYAGMSFEIIDTNKAAKVCSTPCLKVRTGVQWHPTRTSCYKVYYTHRVEWTLRQRKSRLRCEDVPAIYGISPNTR